MVSTRNHPRNFPPPQLSPSKETSTSTSPESLAVVPSSPSKRTRRETNGKAVHKVEQEESEEEEEEEHTTTSKAPVVRTRRSVSSTRTKRSSGWSHTPPGVALSWYIISIPLVIMDFLYCLLRPYTFRDGPLFWPFYVPYDWYGRVDLLYGQGAYYDKNGFTAAQSIMNIFETALYAAYVYIVFKHGVSPPAKKAKGAPAISYFASIKAPRTLKGEPAALAVLLAFTACIMTLSKTVLYWLNEWCSDYAAVGHNRGFDLAFWLFMNGLWIAFPAYLSFYHGQDIIDGLVTGSKSTKSE